MSSDVMNMMFKFASRVLDFNLFDACMNLGVSVFASECAELRAQYVALISWLDFLRLPSLARPVEFGDYALFFGVMNFAFFFDGRLTEWISFVVNIVSDYVGKLITEMLIGGTLLYIQSFWCAMDLKHLVGFNKIAGAFESLFWCDLVGANELDICETEDDDIEDFQLGHDESTCFVDVLQLDHSV